VVTAKVDGAGRAGHSEVVTSRQVAVQPVPHVAPLKS
jgi:hypothetical protein